MSSTLPTKQPSFYQFKTVLTDEQLDQLCDADDADGYAGARLIITNEGVFYMDDDYRPEHIKKHFDMFVDQTVDSDEEDDQ